MPAPKDKSKQGTSLTIRAKLSSLPRSACSSNTSTPPPSSHASNCNAGLTPVKLYLIAFNALSTLLWGRLLVLTLWFICTPRSDAGRWAHAAPLLRLEKHLSGSYGFHGLGEATKYTQTLAVMEVVHALLGLVRSPVGTVAGQVASRLWAVWGVVEMVPAVSVRRCASAGIVRKPPDARVLDLCEA
jgi:hypothetical protein